MADIIQIRRDLAANWTSVNPILASGELGLETDTNGLKTGDAITAWNSLPYLINPVILNFIEISATYSSISSSTSKRVIYILADENNGGLISLYIHTGISLKFLQTVA